MIQGLIGREGKATEVIDMTGKGIANGKFIAFRL